jgi:hypothetical protein
MAVECGPGRRPARKLARPTEAPGAARSKGAARSPTAPWARKQQTRSSGRTGRAFTGWSPSRAGASSRGASSSSSGATYRAGTGPSGPRRPPRREPSVSSITRPSRRHADEHADAGGGFPWKSSQKPRPVGFPSSVSTIWATASCGIWRRSHRRPRPTSLAPGLAPGRCSQSLVSKRGREGLPGRRAGERRQEDPQVRRGARGEIRTPTPFRTPDPKVAAARHGCRRYVSSRVIWCRPVPSGLLAS